MNNKNKEPTAIMWFRYDLTLADNPALSQAATNKNILCIYIADGKILGREIGRTSKVWLNGALTDLTEQLDGNLSCYQGDTNDVFEKLIKKYNITNVYWNNCYLPSCMRLEDKIKKLLQQHEITYHTHHSYLLWNPLDLCKQDGSNYQVFTPFYKNALTKKNQINPPAPKPRLANKLIHDNKSCAIKKLQLTTGKAWEQKILEHWQPTTKAGLKLLNKFNEDRIQNYNEERNFPYKIGTSQLSAYLHFGQITPRQIWHAATSINTEEQAQPYLRQLMWREFSFNQLYFYKNMFKANLKPQFDLFPWQKNKKLLTAWQQGQTGIPIVDAGMRELYATGYMHNRLRMIVGSFLVKNLLIDWREGEKWFWDCLIDADLANNSAGWQWTAGCGFDAAPYFRVFNPVTQSERFDGNGDYIKKWVPELKALPPKYLFSPWTASPEILKNFNIELNKNYPKPIVDLQESRLKALEAFSSIKQNEIQKK